jgi:hypothetical protein
MATQRSGRSPRTRNPGPSLVTEIGTSGSAATVAGGAVEAAGRAALAWLTSAPRAYRNSRMPSPVAAEMAKNGSPRRLAAASASGSRVRPSGRSALLATTIAGRSASSGS